MNFGETSLTPWAKMVSWCLNGESSQQACALILFHCQQEIDYVSQPTLTKTRVILLIEDSSADVYIVRESLTKHLKDFDLHVVNDGEKAFKWIEAADLDPSLPCPSLMLLDLNLPKRSGQEILRRMRQSPRCGNVPIVILTSSDSPADRAETARLGATAYFRKPPDLEEFMQIGMVVERVLDKQKN
jgi:CheY-like chemotaxis protein